jgi:uncharacterized lipoprotein YajG
MKNSAILLILIALTGCASTQEVVNTVPSAVGTIAAAAVFGGEVSMNPDPVDYIKQDVNREGRIIYGDARRNTKDIIAYSIRKLFEPTK